MNISTFQIITLIIFILFVSVIVYASNLTDYLIKKHWFGFDNTRSKKEQIDKVKMIGIFGAVIFGILMTNNSQLIIGLIMIAIGVFTIRKSGEIHKILASSGIGDVAWFRGDDGVKAAGIFMVVVGAWWMSGLTQTLLFNFLRTGNLI